MVASPSAVARIHDAAIRLFAERGGRDLPVSDLAAAAGVARGTIYNNIERPEDLYQAVVSGLAAEMHARISASMDELEDPAHRLATGLRMFIRRAHDEPHWGRFMVRFAGNDETLRQTMDAPPAADIARGVESGRFSIRAGQAQTVVALLSGAAIAAMHAVLAGRQTWRAAGADSAELILRALGVRPAEAGAIARAALPPLLSARPSASTRRK